MWLDWFCHELITVTGQRVFGQRLPRGKKRSAFFFFFIKCVSVFMSGQLKLVQINYLTALEIFCAYTAANRHTLYNRQNNELKSQILTALSNALNVRCKIFNFFFLILHFFYRNTLCILFIYFAFPTTYDAFSWSFET